MNTYHVNLTHSDIWKDDSNEPITHHEIEGVTIEVDTDCGLWWITDVIVDGLSYNSMDGFDPSTFQGPSEVEAKLEEGIDIETAAEECGAVWMVRIADTRFFFFPEKTLTQAIEESIKDNDLADVFEIKNECSVIVDGREVYQVQPEEVAKDVIEDFRNYDGFEAPGFYFNGKTYYFVKQ